MTPTGRQTILVLGLLVGALLLVLGLFVDSNNANTSIAVGASMCTGVLGFATGDRNGEKRLAAAIVTGDADAASVALPRRQFGE